LVAFLGVHYSGLGKMRLDLPPEVLAQKAHEMIARLGYSERPTDTAFSLDFDNDFKDYVEKNDTPRPDWDAVLSGRPSLLRFWYRQSPQYMLAEGYQDQLLSPGIVSRYDPPNVLSGMINLELDGQGNLISFQAIPPQKENPPAATAPFDWNVLFAAAGLDPAKLQKTEPAWNSLASSDTRGAWTGTLPGTTRPLRVEAASLHGKPVFFSMIGDWTKPDRMKGQDDSTGRKFRRILAATLLIFSLMAALYLARRNYRQGRADREGAFRLGLIIFVLEIALWLCRGHLVPSLDTFGLLVLAISTGLFVSGTTWLLYLALEPWVRRRWPQTIISWSRLLSGQMRDPLVGRDILFGVMLGVTWILIFQIRYIPMMRMGASPGLASSEYLMSGRSALGAWLMQIPISIIGTLQFFFLLLGLKVLLGFLFSLVGVKLVRATDWLAAIAFVSIFALPRGLSSSYVSVELPAQILVYTIAVIIVFRFGLVPLACAIFTVNMLANVPFTADTSAWYMTTSVLALLSVVALVGWGFYHSLGGEPIWRPEIE
jgi:serine/threonine-protein kinase